MLIHGQEERHQNGWSAQPIGATGESPVAGYQAVIFMIRIV